MELRTLRQEVARFKHAWQQQKTRADRFEQENQKLRARFKLLEEEMVPVLSKRSTSYSSRDFGRIQSRVKRHCLAALPQIPLARSIEQNNRSLKRTVQFKTNRGSYSEYSTSTKKEI